MAANSVSLPVTRILTEALRHLRYLILEELTERCSEALSLDSISWILTVPAIWNKSTKQLIKEIAIEVSIKKHLVLFSKPGFILELWILKFFSTYFISFVTFCLDEINGK